MADVRATQLIVEVLGGVPDVRATQLIVEVLALEAAYAPPETPAGVAAVATGETTVTVTWGDVANETGYRVESSVDGSTGWVDRSGSLAADTVTFGDTGLTAATTYWYRVIAFNLNGDSAASAVVDATTDSPPPPVVGESNRMGGSGAIRHSPPGRR